MVTDIDASGRPTYRIRRGQAGEIRNSADRLVQEHALTYPLLRERIR